MRTKTLLLAAVLGAAGVASSMAQVYSVNAVGYINLSLVPGFNLIANQLNASPNNSLETLFGTSLAAGDTISRFNGNGFDNAIALGDGTFLYSGPTFALAPGEGAYIQTTAAKTVTLVGDVPQGAALTVSMPIGFSVVSSIVPQSATLGSLGFPVAAGDTISFYNGTGFDSWISLDASGTNFLPPGGPLPAEPTPAVGQSFFVNRSAAATWTRNFSVNGP